MNPVLWLPDALLDLQRLHSYLSKYSTDAANRLLNDLRAAAGSLAEFPDLGRPYEGAAEFHELVVPFGRRGYIVRYRILGDDIVIVRV